MKPPAWSLVLLAFLAYAVAFALAARYAPHGLWRSQPYLWSWARRIPYYASPALCLLAWATKRKNEGPAPKDEPLLVSAAEPGALPHRHATLSPVEPHHAPAGRYAQAVVALLSLSGALDVIVGAMAEDRVPWKVAWVTSGATYGLVAVILAWWLIRSSRAPWRT